MNTLIIPSITSHSRCGSTWRHKIAELRTLPITKVALFVTGLTLDERIECYQRLLAVKAERHFTIPFVHAVSSMCEEEYQFLIKNFGTEKFNLHPLSEYPLQYELSTDLRSRISIENSSSNTVLEEKDLEGFGGICLDVSHYESLRLKQPLLARKLAELAGRKGVSANHMSGIHTVPEINHARQLEYSCHHLTDDCTIDYAAHLPENMFAPVCALEVENSLAEQLRAIENLRALLASRAHQLAA